jgi:hypothetical protein
VIQVTRVVFLHVGRESWLNRPVKEKTDSTYGLINKWCEQSQHCRQCHQSRRT